MPAQPAKEKLIIDTDIGVMNDDCTACMFALMSPALDVLGITPIAGNFDLAFEVEAALRLLELIGRTEVPVCAGFDRPLVHERGTYENQVWGQWATFQAPEPPFGQFASKRPDPRHAVDFIIEKVLEYPGEVNIAAVGPLTNLAVAIRKAPEIVEKIKRVVVMGGAVAALPNGQGNINPTAEFNFWVDPEAARIVLRSGAVTTLFPLNVCRQTHFDYSCFTRIITARTPAAQLIGQYLARHFESPEIDKANPRLFYGLYDHVVIASIIQPEIIQSTRMYVDVDLTHGPAYGASYGYRRGAYQSGKEYFPIDEPVMEMEVAASLDFDRLVELYIQTITAQNQG